MALILVLIVLSILAMIGTPFVISMALQDRESVHFAGVSVARLAAESARNHAVAALEDTVYGVEFERERQILDEERPSWILSREGMPDRPRLRRPRSLRSQPGSRRGSVIRRDRGESPPPRETRRGPRRPGDPRDTAGIPDALRTSEKGPSPRDVDPPEELEAPPLETVRFPPEEGRAGSTVSGDSLREDVTARGTPADEFNFRDPAGVFATATVEDEQGKIHLDTAPPNLIANLFGVSQLATPLAPGDTRVVLDDAGMFPTDGDPGTIDGAVILEGTGEAITYRGKEGEALVGCFRSAYLSIPEGGMEVVPTGTFVYSLEGWKVGYHRLWARREGGFHPRKLTRFETVESIREIAGWQIASLFVTRFRGTTLTAEFLRESGVNLRRLSELGLDPYLFAGEDLEVDRDLDREYEEARRFLRRRRFPDRLVRNLREVRGARVVVDLAARLEGAGREEWEREREEIERSLSAERRRPVRLAPEYLREALVHLAECYRCPGLETLLPEDLERIRGAVTVSSRLPAEWSESQAVLSDVPLDAVKPTVRLPRATELNPGTIVRLRSLSDPEHVEFNEVASSPQGIAAEGGATLAWPVRGRIRARDALVEALQRHPVHINTADRRVLRAVLTGVRRYGDEQVVTPYEADRLATILHERVPIRGHDELYGILLEAAREEVLDEEDVLPLLINAVCPTSSQLRVSTTGFCYSSGDVYTVESRGIVRSRAGEELGQVAFRELIEVASPRILERGLLTQADFAEGMYLRDPFLAVGPTVLFPERHRQYLIGFPGTLGHLVLSKPLLLHRAPLAFPGGDLGNLRLFPAETGAGGRFTLGEIYHFRDTYEGLELAHGEPWTLSLSLSGDGDAGGPPVVPGGALPGAAGGSRGDLTTVPGGIELWMRMRTFPEATDGEGNLVLFDAGTEPDRNRISLLYSVPRGELSLRIRDSSLPDPSLPREPEGGQYLEVFTRRALELETWYHLRALWDGVHGGGGQLFVDGIPTGTDNLSTDLLTAIPMSGPVQVIHVRDATGFPREGVVRIGCELFEYTRSGNSLRVRQQPPSHWVPIPTSRDQATALREGRATAPVPRSALPEGPDSILDPAWSRNMRSPWNRRGGMATAHAAGARVVLHGYSLEIRRKLWNPATRREEQIDDGDSRQLVWGRGGRRLLEPLHAFTFPPEVESAIYHYVDFTNIDATRQPEGARNPLPAGDADTSELRDRHIVPMFRLQLLPGETRRPGGRPPGQGPGAGGPVPTFQYTAVLPKYGRPAVDYFQSRGVCRVGGSVVVYRKEPLPAGHMEAQRVDPRVDPAHPQTMGLLIEGPYVSSSQITAAAGAGDAGSPDRTRVIRPRLGDRVTQLSALVDGPMQRLYPPRGVVELRGSPTPWEQEFGRPDVAGQSLFEHHPDDAVEWIRYIDIQDNLLVGRTGGNSNFRGYPERSLREKKQLDHPAGTSLRLVMELAEGGAGFGDFVTISSSDPDVFESDPRRIYKVLENADGRFFVSLVPVSSSGRDLSGVADTYRNEYTRAMNPRLVKFPSGELPRYGTGRGLLFANVFNPPSFSGRSNPGGVRVYEEEDPTGITIDEVRRFRNPLANRAPDSPERVRHVLVPLEGGSVRLERGSSATATISGVIPQERSIVRTGPLEVLVVTVSTERGRPSLFAEGLSEGLLRIGDEVFYWEDPTGDTGGASRGTFRFGVPDRDTRVQSYNQDRDGNERNYGVRNAIREQFPPAGVPVSGKSGDFEPQGFVRLEDPHQERSRFYEVLYYDRVANAFFDCLRGQFDTPILSGATYGTVHSVTRRLRLVGRGLLGTERKTHGLGETCVVVPYLNMRPVLGALTDTGIPVQDATEFSRTGGYLLMDSGLPTVPWEILAHLGPAGESQLARPRDQRGRGILRACFGTRMTPVSSQYFAYEMPYRFPDRYEPQVESEALAFLQKSFRVPGAYWRGLEWLQRPTRNLRELRADIVILARFDGECGWDVEPTNEPGGLYLFEDMERERSRGPVRVPLERRADQLEIRVCFRYPSGSFTRLPEGRITDDWKESPILEYLRVEYEKAGTTLILRHEELPF